MCGFLILRALTPRISRVPEDTYQEQKQREHFLKSLHKIIRSPILSDDEHEYLVTQVIAEYFAIQPYRGGDFSVGSTTE